MSKEINLHNTWNMIRAYFRKWGTPREAQDFIKDYAHTEVVNEDFLKDALNNPDLDEVSKTVLIRTELVRQKSPECLVTDPTGKSKCIKCSCPTPDKFYESDACEYGCYKEWKDDSDTK